MTERSAERRSVTALFVDVLGSSALIVQLDSERFKRALNQALNAGAPSPPCTGLTHGARADDPIREPQNRSELQGRLRRRHPHHRHLLAVEKLRQ